MGRGIIGVLLFLVSIYALTATYDNNVPSGVGDPGLMIMQWNCRSVKSNCDLLQDHLNCNDYDILLLQSLNCKPYDLPNFTKYCYPPLYTLGANGKVAVATYSKPELIIKRKCFPVIEGAAAVCIEVELRNDKLNVLNMYYPGTDKKGAWVPEISKGGEWVVGGDFNAHSSLWDDNCIREDAGLRDQLINSDLVLLNDGTPTRIPDCSSHRLSAIDLTVATPNIASTTIWEIGGDTLFSDHIPIKIFIDKFPIRENENIKEKFVYDRADWSGFKEASKVNLDGLPSNADSLNEFLTDHILTCARKHIPVSKHRSKPNNPWWNDECQRAVHQKQKTCKRYKRNSTEDNFIEMQTAKIECKRVIAKAKKEQWTKYVNDIDGYEDLSAVYKRINKMKKGYRPPNSVLKVNNKTIITNQAKADALASHFAKIGSREGLTPEMRAHREAAERSVPIWDPPVRRMDINRPLSMDELESALSDIKNIKVSEGQDGSSYRLIKESSTEFKQALLELYNVCWKNGQMPQRWKHAIVTPILKAGKLRSDINSYRPISLTSHIGKVYERMINNRLLYYCEKKNLIPTCQAGFRRGRGVSDHLIKIGAHIKKAYARRKILLSCFFDIRRAYDTVWHYHLLNKIKEIGLCGNMYNFTKAFLTNRTFQVVWKGSQSAVSGLEMGVPQGSVIAPLLFNLAIHDIDMAVKNSPVHMAVYADDVAVWLETKSRKVTAINNKSNSKYLTSMKEFQRVVSFIDNYLWQRGFALAPEKTVFLLVAPAAHKARGLTSLRVQGTNIEPQPMVKYLGTYFTNKNNNNMQINENISKANRAINVIRMLSRMPWASQPRTQVYLAQALVRSRLIYGWETFYDATESQINKLKTVECKALRIAMGLPNSTPQLLVYREAGLLPLDHEIKKRAALYSFRFLSVPNSTVREDLTPITNSITTLKEYTSIEDYTAEILEQAKIIDHEVAPNKLHVISPWLLKKQPIHADLENIRKLDNPLINGAIANGALEAEYANHIKIFTDGSVGEDGVGSAFVIPELGIEQRFLLPPVSVFTAEALAILLALNFILTNPQGLWVICSDSRAALISIKRDKTSSREDIIRGVAMALSKAKDQGKSVTLQWVPAHVGVPGNEKADRAAKLASKGIEARKIDLPLSYSDVKRKIVQAAWKLNADSFVAQSGNYSTTIKDVPRKGGIKLPPMSTHVAQLIHRARCNHWKTKFTNEKCICDRALSYQHVLIDCVYYKDYFKPVIDLCNAGGLTPDLANIFGEGNGWNYAQKAATYLLKSAIGHLL